MFRNGVKEAIGVASLQTLIAAAISIGPDLEDL
jgi:hypothetical protein